MSTATKSSVNKKLRVFFIPFFASGHMIPMADLATLFSQHSDVEPTLCLTPANAEFMKPTLDPNVSVLIYPFPSEAAGLPPGQENLSTVPLEEEFKVYKAVDLSEVAHRDLLHEHRPDAVVADIPFWWTTAIGNELGIPRITWHAVGVFPQVVMNSLHKHQKDIVGNDSIIVKDLPGPEIKMPVSELPLFVRSRNFLTEAWGNLKTAQLECYGTIVNTFYEFESAYCYQYRKTDCKQAWFVGPVALARGYNKHEETRKERNKCLKWLDEKEEGSVVFICFGSWCTFKDKQLKEMAIGFEKSGRSFLWVVRKSEGNWMPDDGWEKRVERRGMVVRGWAPQVPILEHKAVGAFLTHCGWNSVLESMVAGVPMLTWPLVFEQFINERLVVEVMGAGERVSEGFRSTRQEEKVILDAETIAKAMSQFMEKEKGQGSSKRMRARECGAAAQTAVAEGGSSWNDLNRLIDALQERREDKLEAV